MQVLLKGGDAAYLASVVPQSGELIIDSDLSKIRAGDGNTPGGQLLAETIVSAIVNTPSIVTPLTSGSATTATMRIVTTAYRGSGLHTESTWQLSKDSDFTNVELEHITDTELTQFIPYLLGFKGSGIYYIRAKHKSSTAGYSSYSPTVVVRLAYYPVTEGQQLNAPNPFGSFGAALAVTDNGETLYAGQSTASTATYAGMVHVYDDGGTGVLAETAVLTAPVPVDGDSFGNALDCTPDGSVLAVGAMYAAGASLHSGIVHVFLKDVTGAYNVVQSIVPPEPVDDWFYFGSGISLSGDGDTLVIGAKGYDEGAIINVGRFYVYKRDAAGTYQYTAFIDAPNTVAIQYAGSAISVSNNGRRIVVGVFLTDTVYGLDTGAVYVFDLDSNDDYILTQTLFKTDPRPSDNFGRTVAINGDAGLLAVGVPKDASAGIDAGAIHYYNVNASNQYVIDTTHVPLEATTSTAAADVIAISNNGMYGAMRLGNKIIMLS